MQADVCEGFAAFIFCCIAPCISLYTCQRTHSVAVSTRVAAPSSGSSMFSVYYHCFTVGVSGSTAIWPELHTGPGSLMAGQPNEDGIA